MKHSLVMLCTFFSALTFAQEFTSSDLFQARYLPELNEASEVLTLKQFNSLVPTLGSRSDLACSLLAQNDQDSAPTRSALLNGPIKIMPGPTAHSWEFIPVQNPDLSQFLEVTSLANTDHLAQALALPHVTYWPGTKLIKLLSYAQYSPNFTGEKSTLGNWRRLEIKLNRKQQIIDLRLALVHEDSEDSDNTFVARELECHRPRLPIIFLHGLIVPDSVYKNEMKISLPLLGKVGLSFELSQFFKEYGYDFSVADRPWGADSKERAEHFAASIEKLSTSGKFHLLGHSAGGVDGRLILSERADLAQRCESLTSMGSPHYGSRLANEIEKYFKGEESLYSASITMDLLWKKYARSDESKAKAFKIAHEFTPEGMAIFNQQVKNVPGVKYQSVAFELEQPYELYSRSYVHRGAKIFQAWGLASDGTVEVESQKWGKLLGILPGDHFSATAPISYGYGINEEVSTLESMRKGTGQVWKRNFRFVIDELDDLD